jgi:hypothetical protein
MTRGRRTIVAATAGAVAAIVVVATALAVLPRLRPNPSEIRAVTQDKLAASGLPPLAIQIAQQRGIGRQLGDLVSTELAARRRIAMPLRPLSRRTSDRWDRRPNANIDPYTVTRLLVDTIEVCSPDRVAIDV